MRTNIVLDDKLIRDAMRVAGVKTKREAVDVALRRFRRAIERTGLIPELRARTAYEKPTAERKRKKAAAVARVRKQIKRSLPPKKRY